MNYLHASTIHKRYTPLRIGLDDLTWLVARLSDLHTDLESDFGTYHDTTNHFMTLVDLSAAWKYTNEKWVYSL